MNIFYFYLTVSSLAAVLGFCVITSSNYTSKLMKHFSFLLIICFCLIAIYTMLLGFEVLE